MKDPVIQWSLQQQKVQHCKFNLFSFWEKRQFNKDLPSSSWRCNYLIKVLPFTSRSCNGMDSTILPKPRLLLGGCAKPYTSIEIAYPRPPPPWFSKVTTKLSLNVLFFGKRGGGERYFRKALPHTILQFKGGNNTGQSNPNRPFLECDIHEDNPTTAIPYTSR